MCLHAQTTFQRGNNSSLEPGAANGNLDLAGLKAEDRTLVHQVQMKLHLYPSIIMCAKLP